MINAPATIAPTTIYASRRQATHCAFCKKSRKDLKKLICASNDEPDITICDECVSICLNIVMEEPSLSYFIGGCV